MPDLLIEAVSDCVILVEELAVSDADAVLVSDGELVIDSDVDSDGETVLVRELDGVGSLDGVTVGVLEGKEFSLEVDDGVAGAVSLMDGDSVTAAVSDGEELIDAVCDPLSDDDVEDELDGEVVSVSETDGDMVSIDDADSDGVADPDNEEDRDGVIESEAVAEIDADDDAVIDMLVVSDEDSDCEDVPVSLGVIVLVAERVGVSDGDGELDDEGAAEVDADFVAEPVIDGDGVGGPTSKVTTVRPPKLPLHLTPTVEPMSMYPLFQPSPQESLHTSVHVPAGMQQLGTSTS